MDETTLRWLARELLIELSAVISADAERAPVEVAVQAALATPEGQGRRPLLDALSAHQATRAWMREHGAREDAVRGGLPGDPTTPLGLYYVCPDYHDDLVLLAALAEIPRCPKCGLEMRLEQG